MVDQLFRILLLFTMICIIFNTLQTLLNHTFSYPLYLAQHIYPHHCLSALRREVSITYSQLPHLFLLSGGSWRDVH
jgi:hypothetical protein